MPQTQHSASRTPRYSGVGRAGRMGRMALLHDHFPGLDLGHLRLGTTPTPVRRLDGELVGWPRGVDEGRERLRRRRLGRQQGPQAGVDHPGGPAARRTHAVHRRRHRHPLGAGGRALRPRARAAHAARPGRPARRRPRARAARPPRAQRRRAAPLPRPAAAQAGGAGARSRGRCCATGGCPGTCPPAAPTPSAPWRTSTRRSRSPPGRGGPAPRAGHRRHRGRVAAAPRPDSRSDSAWPGCGPGSSAWSSTTRSRSTRSVIADLANQTADLLRDAAPPSTWHRSSRQT